MSGALALPRAAARAPPPPPPRACLQCARRRFAAPAGGAACAPRPLLAPPGVGGQGPAERPAPGAEAGAAAPAETREPEAAEAPAPESAGIRAALAALRFYKVAISPLLPPSCRFLPTCSSYAVEAYKRHGVARGTALTAWRLLRCNPFNPGRGYDPVAWPPPGLGWMFGAAGGE